jgi:LysM repeat protein
MKRVWITFIAMVILCLIGSSAQASSVFTNDGGLTFWHHIRPGERLTELVRDYAPDFTPNPVRQLQKLNNLTSDRIYAGEDLQIPTEWIRPHVEYVPTPTPTKEHRNMNYLLTQILLWTVLIVAALILLYLIGRGLGVFHAQPAARLIATDLVHTTYVGPSHVYYNFDVVIETEPTPAPPPTPPTA